MNDSMTLQYLTSKMVYSEWGPAKFVHDPEPSSFRYRRHRCFPKKEKGGKVDDAKIYNALPNRGSPIFSRLKIMCLDAKLLLAKATGRESQSHGIQAFRVANQSTVSSPPPRLCALSSKTRDFVTLFFNLLFFLFFDFSFFLDLNPCLLAFHQQVKSARHQLSSNLKAIFFTHFL
jgi:hypothetical protein